MTHLPYDFQVWNALVNLLREAGVTNPTDLVDCRLNAPAQEFRVKAAKPIRPVLRTALSSVLHRPLDATQSAWTLTMRDAVALVRTDII